MNNAALWPLLLSIALVVARSAAAAEPAAAEPAPSSAAQLFQDALRDYDRGDLDAAIAKLEQAQATAPHPTVLYNLALFLEAAGRHAEACKSFEQYLAAPGARIDAEREQAVRAKVLGLRQRLAALRIETSPKQAQVRIDGHAVDLASEVLLEPGRHGFEARLDGFEPLQLELSPAAGEVQHLVVQLKPLPGTEPAPRIDTRPQTLALQPTAPASSLRAGVAARPTRTWAAIAVAAGTVVAGAAVVLHVVNAARDTDWQAKDRQLNATPPAGRGDAYWQARADNAELARSIRHLDGLELGLFIGAGALAATGVGLWLTPSVRDSSRSAGLTFRGDF